MKLTYHLQMSDIVAFNQYHFQHSPTLQRNRRIFNRVVAQLVTPWHLSFQFHNPAARRTAVSTKSSRRFRNQWITILNRFRPLMACSTRTRTRQISRFSVFWTSVSVGDGLFFDFRGFLWGIFTSLAAYVFCIPQ